MRITLGKVVRSLAALMIVLAAKFALAAPPTISKVSLPGLQIGATTTVVVAGSELLPNPRVLLNAPLKSESVKPGAKPNRVELEIALDAKDVLSGIYLLRVATDEGVSNAIQIGVDPLPQLPFAAEIASLPVALHGTLSGNQVLRTSFSGKQGDEVVVEIEAKRLGAALNPVLHLLDARRTQIAWSQELSSIGGDARIVAKLPADGKYMIELHDSLYQAGNPNQFRLRIGSFYFADHLLPLAIEQGKDAIFQLVGTNWNQADAPAPIQHADRLLHMQPLGHYRELIGFRPSFLASDFPELLADPEKNDDSPHAVPVGISGRIAKPNQETRHKIAVQPGKKLRVEVFAQRLGSPLDGVLTIFDESGKQLAMSDDQPNTSDPGLDFAVPGGMKTLVLAVKDVAGRGGADYIYRLAVTETDRPDFSLSLGEDRWHVSPGGNAVVRVEAARKNYNGPIKLAFHNLPPGIQPLDTEIPPEASVALVALNCRADSRHAGIFYLNGTSNEPALTRPALPPDNATFQQQPWLRRELAISCGNIAPLLVAWEPPTAETHLTLGGSFSAPVKITRGEGAAGPVRLSLITSQMVPTKKPAKGAKPGAKADEDQDRALRLKEVVTIPADKSDGNAKILVPGDLPRVPYDLALRAELLSADGQNVTATAFTSVRRMTTINPLQLQLVGEAKIDARAGLGPTGKFTGKIVRGDGFSGAVRIALEGLPSGVTASEVEVPSDKTDFEFPVSLTFGAKPGDLAGAKLFAASIPANGSPDVVRSNEIAVTLKVVPGEKPATEKPHEIFEDAQQFADQLTEGDGRVSLVTDDVYSGQAALKVEPLQAVNHAIPGMSLKIREKPAAGEYRYIRYAWKKKGGEQLCLQFAHDGQWGPQAGATGKFRYHAGKGDCFGASILIDEKLPDEWTVVTRDLFADFGEFTLTGLAFSPLDGEYALFDHVYLGRATADFDTVKPDAAKPDTVKPDKVKP